MPAIVVTHDRIEALALGDRLAVLIDGTIRQAGPVHQVFSAPVDAEVARVVGTENVFPARLLRREQGLVVVRTSGPAGAELVAVDPGDLEDEAFACIRAEEVLLETIEEHATSAQNRLPGVILSRRDEGPLSRITVACGRGAGGAGDAGQRRAARAGGRAAGGGGGQGAVGADRPAPGLTGRRGRDASRHAGEAPRNGRGIAPAASPFRFRSRAATGSSCPSPPKSCPPS